MWIPKMVTFIPTCKSLVDQRILGVVMYKFPGMPQQLV